MQAAQLLRQDGKDKQRVLGLDDNLTVHVDISTQGGEILFTLVEESY